MSTFSAKELTSKHCRAVHRITREHRKSDSNSCHNGCFYGVEGESGVQIIWLLTVHAQTRALLIIGSKMKNRYRYPGFLEVDSAILFIRCESDNGFLYYNFDTRTLEFILWIVCLKHITIILCKTFVLVILILLYYVYWFIDQQIKFGGKIFIWV